VGKFCAERNVALLKEIRYVTSEVGPDYAWRMPREYRQWWISEMQKEKEELDEIRSGIKRRNV
jgi:hypothetical protein